MHQRQYRNSEKIGNTDKSTGFTNKLAGLADKSTSFLENRRSHFRPVFIRNRLIFIKNW
jgi:hypothetical protein